jgi:hypothetical protein
MDFKAKLVTVISNITKCEDCPFHKLKEYEYETGYHAVCSITDCYEHASYGYLPERCPARKRNVLNFTSKNTTQTIKISLHKSMMNVTLTTLIDAKGIIDCNTCPFAKETYNQGWGGNHKCPIYFDESKSIPVSDECQLKSGIYKIGDGNWKTIIISQATDSEGI